MVVKDEINDIKKMCFLKCIFFLIKYSVTARMFSSVLQILYESDIIFFLDSHSLVINVNNDDQAIKLPKNEELPNKSTIKCVKYNVLSSLVFKIMNRHRGEDHSKLTGIFPWKYFVFTSSLWL